MSFFGSSRQGGSFQCGSGGSLQCGSSRGGSSKDYLRGKYIYSDISTSDWITINGISVYKVELFRCPVDVGGQTGTHQGVVLQLCNGRGYLVHKRVDLRTEEVVVEVKPAEKMSAKWTKVSEKYVSGKVLKMNDFLAACGLTFNLINNNCQHAAQRMMNLAN